MNITDFAFRRPVTVFVIFACFVVLGGITSRLIPLDFLPDVDFPGISVNLPYPGSTPEEVERQITRPAEEVLATISDVKRMSSDSNENGAGIFLEFDWGIDTDLKALEVRERLDGIRDQFPQDMERFFVERFGSSDIPLLTLRLSSDRDLSNAYDLLDRKLKRRIERLNGVAKVDLYGVEKKEVRIQLLSDRIAAYQLNLGQLTQTLQRANFAVSAGRITDGNRRFMLRPMGEFTDINEIGDIIVGPNNLRLSDIAEIEYKQPTQNYGRHLDGKYAIGLEISKESGANTVEVTRAIKAEITEIEKDPEMTGIRIFYMEDLAEGIVSSLNELLESGLLGGLFSIIVLFLFLRQFSTTLIVSLAVPFSLMITLVVLYFLGVTLNILTMMGLMLAIGMLVDNAVVITENIHRNHSLYPDDKHGATRRGVKEVAVAVTAGTITTAIVFLPNIISAGNEVTIYLKQVAITICVALGASLLIAQTVIPLLTSRVKVPKKSTKSTFIDWMTKRYGGLINWTLGHRWTTSALMLVILISPAFLIATELVKTDMFPPQEDRRMQLAYNFHGTYTIEEVEANVDRMEAFLLANKDRFDIESVYSYYENGFASSTLLLKKDGRSEEELKELMRDELPKIAIGQPGFEFNRGGNGRNGVRLQLIGESSERLTALAEDVAWRLRQVEGLRDVQSQAQTGGEEIHVVVNRDRTRQYGLSTQDVAQMVAVAMRGQNLRRFRGENGEIDVRLAFQDTDRQSLEDLQNITIAQTNGQQLTLASVADFRVRRGPRNIHREERTTMLGISVNLADDLTPNEARDRIRTALADYQLPTGYTWGFGFGLAQEDDTFNTMIFNILIALVLIYLVMAALFESLIYPSAIITSIFFAIVGVFWFFFITNTTFSLMAMIGILVLMGVVVNNGIVLIDHINQLRTKGLTRHEAIIQGGKDRLRPILMTAATTVLGLVPLCIGTTLIGGDGPPYFPMARAIVGGLTFSTVVTLVMLPLVYILLDDLRRWSREITRRATATTVQRATA